MKPVEWYYSRLVPNSTHVVVSESNLTEAVKWLRENDELAREVREG